MGFFEGSIPCIFMAIFRKMGIRMMISTNPTTKQMKNELKNIPPRLKLSAGAPWTIADLYAKNTMQNVINGV